MSPLMTTQMTCIPCQWIASGYDYERWNSLEDENDFPHLSAPQTYCEVETGGIESHEVMLSANINGDESKNIVLSQQDNVTSSSDHYQALRNIHFNRTATGISGVISGAPVFQLTFCDGYLRHPYWLDCDGWASHLTMANSSMYKLGIALGSTQASWQTRLVWHAICLPRRNRQPIRRAGNRPPLIFLYPTRFPSDNGWCDICC